MLYTYGFFARATDPLLVRFIGCILSAKGWWQHRIRQMLCWPGRLAHHPGIAGADMSIRYVQCRSCLSNVSQVLCLWRSKCQSVHPLLAPGSSESCGQTPRMHRMQVQHIVYAAILKCANSRISARKNSANAAPYTQAVCMCHTSYVQSKRQQKVESNLNRTVLDDIVHDKVRLACVFWLDWRFDDFTRCFSRVDDESKRNQLGKQDMHQALGPSLCGWEPFLVQKTIRECCIPVG